jgi:hypothetical protein
MILSKPKDRETAAGRTLCNAQEMSWITDLLLKGLPLAPFGFRAST